MRLSYEFLDNFFRAYISGEILSGRMVGETKQILREEEQKSL